MPLKVGVLLTLLSLIFFESVRAQLIAPETLIDIFAAFLGLPSDLAKWPELLYFFILPFLGTLAIIYGLLENLDLFRNIRGAKKGAVYLLIAISWAGVLIPTGIFSTIILLVYGFAGAYSGILFVIVFLASAFFWGAGTIWRHKGSYIKDRINDLTDAGEKSLDHVVNPILIGKAHGGSIKNWMKSTLVTHHALPANDADAGALGWQAAWGTYTTEISAAQRAAIEGAWSPYAGEIAKLQTRQIKHNWGRWLLVAIIIIMIVLVFILLPLISSLMGGGIPTYRPTGGGVPRIR